MCFSPPPKSTADEICSMRIRETAYIFFKAQKKARFPKKACRKKLRCKTLEVEPCSKLNLTFAPVETICHRRRSKRCCTICQIRWSHTVDRCADSASSIRGLVNVKNMGPVK